jgi:hypothetical protein
VSFVPGVHHCLGAALARLQLEIGLGTLLAGLPALALAADIHTLDWQHGMLGARNETLRPCQSPGDGASPSKRSAEEVLGVCQ